MDQILPVSKSSRTLIALEVRPLQFGFVVIENTQLLDWGVCTLTAGALGSTVAKRILPLIDQYGPFVIALRRRTDSKAYRPQLGLTLREVTTHAKARAVRIEWISTVDVRRYFSSLGYRTKHQIAVAVAELFPELIWKLPPKRKPWQHEHPNILIFDAVATGLSFYDAIKD